MNSTEPLKPPRWADRLLEKFCRKDYLEEIQGDLHESFYWRLETKGVTRAKWSFIKEIFLSFRMSNLKSYNKMDQILTLFKSHIKTGWRFLWKTKGYSSINILGLSVGIVFSLFAYLYTADQLSYNKHLNNVDDLYKMSMQVKVFNNTINLPGSSHVNIQKAADNIPEIVAVARFKEDHAFIKIDESKINQEFLIAEKQLIDYLNLNFLEGNLGDFEAPDQVIISEQLAYKLGIRGEAVNADLQLMDTTNFVTYTVVGVYEDIPNNTSIKTDLFLPYSVYTNKSKKNITNPNNLDLSTILQLTPDANATIVNNKINELMGDRESSNEFIAVLNPIAGLHLDGSYLSGNGFLPGGSSQLIWLIVIAGILCLSISIINYANFSISLYINRAREVAVRKIMGSANSGVFRQLMTESFLTTILAAIVALGLFVLIAPQFSELVEKQFDISDLMSVKLIPGILLILIAISVLSGLYPSILLSRFQIIKSLRGVQKIGKGKFVMQSLLVLQFSISIAMIACMFTFKGQLNHLLNLDRSFNTDDIISINIVPELAETKNTDILLNELTKIPDVTILSTDAGLSAMDYQDGETKLLLRHLSIDSTYIEMFRLNMLMGNDLNIAKENGIPNGVIVNETFISLSNITTNPIGKSIKFKQGDFENSIIVGVVKDFYSLASNPKYEINPIVMFDDPDEKYRFSIYIKSTVDRFVLEDKLKSAWDKIYSPIPLELNYPSVTYNRWFKQEAKIAKIAGTGSFIAIFIASFGLLGLVGLTLQRRLKEVSVRRVLGAGLKDISAIMLKGFIVPIVISLIVGLSTASMLAQEWLKSYHNRISYGWEQISIPAIIIVCILFFVVFTQVFRITKSNPIIHLKDD